MLFYMINRSDIQLVVISTKVMLLGIFKDCHLCLSYGFSECTTAATATIVYWYTVLIKNLSITKDLLLLLLLLFL